MTGSETAQIITSIGTLVAATGALVAASVTLYQSISNGRVLKDVKTQTDGINSKLVEKTGEAEHAKGVLQGAKEERAGRSVEPEANT